jgi:hypothetical protein
MENDYIRDKSQYQISDTKRGMGSDHDIEVDPDLDTMSKKTVDVDSLYVGSDSDSEPEGDDTITIASLLDGANITINSPQIIRNERQTQTESPTQLFPDSDHSDDNVGEFMFEE